MLKKAALLVFGLAMLVGIYPPQAHAGVVVALGPVYPHPRYVYVPSPYAYVAPQPYVAYGSYAPAYVYSWGPYPRYYRQDYWYPRRFERRAYIVRRPYFRR